MIDLKIYILGGNGICCVVYNAHKHIGSCDAYLLILYRVGSCWWTWRDVVVKEDKISVVVLEYHKVHPDILMQTQPQGSKRWRLHPAMTHHRHSRRRYLWKPQPPQWWLLFQRPLCRLKHLCSRQEMPLFPLLHWSSNPFYFYLFLYFGKIPREKYKVPMTDLRLLHIYLCWFETNEGLIMAYSKAWSKAWSIQK